MNTGHNEEWNDRTSVKIKSMFRIRDSGRRARSSAFDSNRQAAMGFLVRDFVTDFFTYETTKSVVVKSWSVGIINRIVQLLIITYFVGWVFIHEKAYQTIDTGIESSVMTKVKGFGYQNNISMDVADYVYPPQGAGVFCIMTKLIITENQFQGKCPEGGEIGINIEWKCNLDLNIEYCVPKYSFTRLDAPFAKNAISKGYNFRFAKYFKTENGTEFRTLHKAFAIRFDVMVTGNAGKFDTIPTLINLVAAFTSIGLGTVLCDIILLNFLKGAEQYKAKKFEEVSEAQIEASLTQSPGSQLSLKPGIRSPYDSGAISLATSDQPM
ncbi:hypothetical protein F2P81_007994 [Scophthalmus maximus]|uniref:Uncharacterized protein n=1 Tax=Scophthalmus maximus TaxID=52904 RepID=A0A6A4T4D3_SCOMX|nr:hypothetical protein F2P81_007994 [Scophthalmus maximus]